MRLCLDFDGYLCKYEGGWQGHDNIGEPILWKIEMVKDLHDLGVDLVLSTTRLNPYPFGEGLMDKPDEFVVNGFAKEKVMEWLQEQGILGFFKGITGYKPWADYYLDDKGWNPSRKELFDRIFTVNPDEQLLGKSSEDIQDKYSEESEQ